MQKENFFLTDLHVSEDVDCEFDIFFRPDVCLWSAFVKLITGERKVLSTANFIFNITLVSSGTVLLLVKIRQWEGPPFVERFLEKILIKS